MAEINPVEVVLSNSDLLTQILKRVPPKPLTSFKIVSKHWLSIISDPHFVVTQTRHHLTTHPLSSLPLFHHQNNDECPSVFPRLGCLGGVRNNDQFGAKLKMVSSCNGLILFQDTCSRSYIVLNPTTQKHRVVPNKSGLLDNKPCLDIVLAFDPLKSFHFKIIHFCNFCNPECIVEINIFSSECGAWKELHLQYPTALDRFHTRMIFSNGAIHWMTSPSNHVRFIVSEEKFILNQIPTNPDTFSEKGEFDYFGKNDDDLLLATSFGDYSMRNDVFTVLEMDKDNYWSPKSQVDLNPLASEYPEMIWFPDDVTKSLQYQVLHVKRGDDNGGFSMILAIPKKIILYEVKNGNGGTDSKVLHETPYKSFPGSYHDIHPLIECLVPVL